MAAKRSQRMFRQLDNAWNLSDAVASFDLVPEAFTGVNLDGRDIVNELSITPMYMKMNMQLTGDPAAAARAGFAYTSSKAATLINDAGRSADRVSVNARTPYTNWIRVCSPGACSRCIQLIGMHSAQDAFLRHPQCKCKAMAVPGEDVPLSEVPKELADIPWDPREYFDKLSPKEQNRRFTVAGAEAIRNGADISRVVNARRAATGIGYGQRDDVRKVGRRLERTNIGSHSNPVWVYRTYELTSKKNMRRYKYRDGVRLMPESIIATWGHDKALLRDRLMHYGYIV